MKKKKLQAVEAMRECMEDRDLEKGMSLETLSWNLHGHLAP